MTSVMLAMPGASMLMAVLVTMIGLSVAVPVPRRVAVAMVVRCGSAPMASTAPPENRVPVAVMPDLHVVAVNSAPAGSATVRGGARM